MLGIGGLGEKHPRPMPGEWVFKVKVVLLKIAVARQSLRLEPTKGDAQALFGFIDRKSKFSGL